jgi:hypothetical protein
MGLNADKDGAGVPGRPAASPGLLTKLQFRCPDTQQLVAYEALGDAQTLEDLWARRLFVTCPHCGTVHRFAFHDAYVQGMLTTPISDLEA